MYGHMHITSVGREFVKLHVFRKLLSIRMLLYIYKIQLGELQW